MMRALFVDVVKVVDGTAPAISRPPLRTNRLRSYFRPGTHAGAGA